MRIPYFEIAAFTSRPFHGNPAGVCVMDEWLPDDVLQKIAAENNLAETAFVVREEQLYRLRWFTPTVEMDLCGHATLGAAFVLFNERGVQGNAIQFESRSGMLAVARRGDKLELNFPSRPPAPVDAPEILVRALGRTPRAVFKSRDYLALFDSQDDVAALAPDFEQIARVDSLGVIATALGRDCDFVSRFFAPNAGVPEDPVTGSAHCTLIPFWAARLNKPELFARQISSRGGELFCRDLGDRVGIAGNAVVYCRGEIEVA